MAKREEESGRYQSISGEVNLGNFSGIGGINSKKADGSNDNLEIKEKGEGTAAETAAKARKTDNGGVRTLGENIARALPESRLRQNMMLKAERKKERLEREKNYAIQHDNPRLEKYLEADKPNNSITAKDVPTFENLAQGNKKSFYPGDNDQLAQNQ